MYDLDPAHLAIDIFADPITFDVWKTKYRWRDELNPQRTFLRVAEAICGKNTELAQKAYHAMELGLFVPGGRIIAGAGTEKAVTLMNCYVNEKMDDSMEGILRAHSNTALTLQQGGGIGTDFSTLRPEGAVLKRTHSKASGPMPFMHMWDASSRTIRSAGERRGAMMGTMCDTHPDLPQFIDAKKTRGALEQFNVSILVSDAFMNAVREDAEWVLFFHIPPVSRKPGIEEYDFVDDDNVQQYAYSVWQARELWEKITKTTYEYSEPGVIFIDRINDTNNLSYCEEIRCTNPCGEQPLPPHGTCNLGHLNLARMVIKPFTSEARIDWGLLRVITEVAVEFLDNVIDITNYPLAEQQEEEFNKRRLGIGFSGLADALAELGIRYGSPEAVQITERIVSEMAVTSYITSHKLALQKGSFFLFDADKYLSEGHFVTKLPQSVQVLIREGGIRNSLLLTVAPVGTGSILMGNISSGCEPVFLHKTKRKVLKPTDGFKDEWEYYTSWGYSARLYMSLHPSDDGLPSHMVTAEDLSVEEHVVMQAAAQRWVDASISKTINVPKDMPYEQFAKVYDLAYSLGCKGCTTYRPSDVRGAVLSAPDSPDGTTRPPVTIVPRPRDPVLHGSTYKIQWPSLTSAIYLTINEDSTGQPFEVLLASKDARYHDWTTALTIMITAIFRMGNDISFVARELQQVQSLNDTCLKDQRFHPSLVAYIGYVIQQHLERKEVNDVESKPTPTRSRFMGQCPNCRQQTLIYAEGCSSCACGYYKCG
jgi:ribonucleoside-diphosphate reductase alpha chain